MGLLEFALQQHVVVISLKEFFAQFFIFVPNYFNVVIQYEGHLVRGRKNEEG